MSTKDGPFGAINGWRLSDLGARNEGERELAERLHVEAVSTNRVLAGFQIGTSEDGCLWGHSPRFGHVRLRKASGHNDSDHDSCRIYVAEFKACEGRYCPHESEWVHAQEGDQFVWILVARASGCTCAAPGRDLMREAIIDVAAGVRHAFPTASVRLEGHRVLIGAEGPSDKIHIWADAEVDAFELVIAGPASASMITKVMGQEDLEREIVRRVEGITGLVAQLTWNDLHRWGDGLKHKKHNTDGPTP